MKDTPAVTFNQAQGAHTPRVGMLSGKRVDADPLGFAGTLLQLTPVFGDALWMLSAKALFVQRVAAALKTSSWKIAFEPLALTTA